MTHAIRLHQTGAPELMQWESIALPPPAAGEVRLRHHAIGLNYIDTYHRSGLYPLTLPAVLGTEAAGVVEAIGPGVNGFKIGDAVGYTGLPPGAYAEKRNWPAERTLRLPAGISAEVAASCMLKGLTAWYLLRRSYRVQAGDPVLLYAAAGGTGTIVGQWAKSLGAKVIGVVSSPAKAELARANGCAETVLGSEPNFVARRKRIAVDIPRQTLRNGE